MRFFNLKMFQFIEIVISTVIVKYLRAYKGIENENTAITDRYISKSHKRINLKCCTVVLLVQSHFWCAIGKKGFLKDRAKKVPRERTRAGIILQLVIVYLSRLWILIRYRRHCRTRTWLIIRQTWREFFILRGWKFLQIKWEIIVNLYKIWIVCNIL